MLLAFMLRSAPRSRHQSHHAALPVCECFSYTGVFWALFMQLALASALYLARYQIHLYSTADRSHMSVNSNKHTTATAAPHAPQNGMCYICALHTSM